MVISEKAIKRIEKIHEFSSFVLGIITKNQRSTASMKNAAANIAKNRSEVFRQNFKKKIPETKEAIITAP